MLTISRDHVTDVLKGGLPVAARCKSGETVAFETRDCYDDNDITAEKPYGSRADGLENPATGPLFVEGAEVGDVLKVEVLSIALRGDGVMRTSPTAGAFHELYQERSARRFLFTRENGVEGFRFDDALFLPCDTMIGVIGTAAPGEGVLTTTPGVHGGNLDCHRIVAGATLYLPVFVPGALLALGDLHARMGDGEVLICGLETAGTVTVRVSVLKGRSAAFCGALPLLAQGGRLSSLHSAPTLDEAARCAAQQMRALVAEAAGLDDVDSGMLLSLLGDLAVCQIVNPLKTVRCEFPLETLEAYGVKLP